MKSFYKYIFIFLLLINCQAEEEYTEILTAEENEEYSGGDATVFDISENAFGFQAPNLLNQEQLEFFVGNSLFNLNWVVSPSSTTARDGLGPLFNSRSCSGCHFKDGRGRPPIYSGELSHGLLLRLSIDEDSKGKPLGDLIYKGQLQDQSIPNIATEGGFDVSYEEINGTFDDGTSYTLYKPTYTFTGLNYGALDSQIKVSPRIANHMSGLGLLDAIPNEIILSNTDEFDSNNDGISGKANYVWNVEENKLTLGKFGWKANQPSIKQQVAGAFNGDMGITTSLFPDENCPPNVNCDDIANGGSPELPDDDFEKVVLYSSSLAVPARRDWEDQDVLQGKKLFEENKCNACHIQTYTTGTHPTLTAMSNQIIHPYTDLLLHDMGDDLSDNRTDFLATGNEWRTPPLWGIGLIETVNGHTNFLHDGRAQSLEEAILWHGGEAERAKNNFKSLNITERNQLIKFLESL
ncbi:di-heme oxidoredictase family protein [Flavicella sp.]|uniref:di-heme oxidoreductase family protein n=1 Tax=Flavicella sp. TaxID=2957742 RepID=UPI00301AF64A